MSSLCTPDDGSSNTEYVVRFPWNIIVLTDHLLQLNVDYLIPKRKAVRNTETWSHTLSTELHDIMILNINTFTLTAVRI